MNLLDRRFFVFTILLTLVFWQSNAGIVDRHSRLPQLFSNSGSTEYNESEAHSNEKSQGGSLSTGSNSRLAYMLRLYADVVRYLPIIGGPLYTLFTTISAIMDGNTGKVLEAAIPCSINMSDGLECIPIRNLNELRSFITKHFLPRIPDSVLPSDTKRIIQLMINLFGTPNVAF